MLKMTKPSKRSRDDRDSLIDYRYQENNNRFRDRDREGKDHGREVRYKESDSHHHHHHHRGHKSSRHEDLDLDTRHSRDGSKDSYEQSHEFRGKRYSTRDEREIRRERSHDTGEVKELEYEERKKRKKREGGTDKELVRDKKPKVSEEKRERNFGEKATEIYDIIDQNKEGMKTVKLNGDGFRIVENEKEKTITEHKMEGESKKIGTSSGDGASSTLKDVWQESPSKPTTCTAGQAASVGVAAGQSFPTKVSSISNTNENKGVCVTRSHEVPGKSSTDGGQGQPSFAGKSGSLSLDALAKAKKALQMQKELSDRLKRIPLLRKDARRTGSDSSLLGLEEEQPAACSVMREEQEVSPIPTNTIISSSSSSSSSSLYSTTVVASAMLPASSVTASLSGITGTPNYEVVKRAQELAAKMGFWQDPQFAPLINLFPGQLPVEIPLPQKPPKVPVLRVDALGREIDEHGNVVNVAKPSNLSTLKVNINKQKKEAFQILKPELDVDPESNPHFDERMGVNKTKLLRPKRMNFQFVEEGKWSREAELIKLKSQFGEESAKDVKARQALHAKAKAAPDSNPNLIEIAERVMTKEKPKDAIPEVEWWDLPLLQTETYGEEQELQLKMEKMSILVEHPRLIQPPAEPPPPPPQPLKLTKKEQKKLRTQRRLAREKDRQEMIRQGLIEPPKPKVKMSNLMKVLGSEATQDPTRLEKEILSAAAEREQAHIDRNTARKLTPAERREKKERKLFDDPNTPETLVSVYKINDLSHKKTRFKVDVNAHENRLTGCAVIAEGLGMVVVVVEGGSKSIKRYGKLMLNRINWAEAVEENEDDDAAAEGQEKLVNKCSLVWQGSIARPSFNKFSIHDCITEVAARKVFSDAAVGHYWDLARNFSDDQI